MEVKTIYEHGGKTLHFTDRVAHEWRRKADGRIYPPVWAYHLGLIIHRHNDTGAGV